MLSELIKRLRSGELDLDSFAEQAAAVFVARPKAKYPDEAKALPHDCVSNATLANAVMRGDLTADEEQAVYAALTAVDA